MKVVVVNGPNLNLLGTRSPDIYGTATLGDLEDRCRRWGRDLGITVETFQSNHEGTIIDRIHQAVGTAAGIVLNAGALTHYAYAVRDAIEAVGLPTVEVHISDVGGREEWRHHSVLTDVCVASVVGEGIAGYRRALEILVDGR